MTTIKTQVITSKEGYEIWFTLDGGQTMELDSVHPTMEEAVRMVNALQSHYNFVNMITKNLKKSKSGE